MYVAKADLEAGAAGARGLSQWLTAARRHVPLGGPEQTQRFSRLGLGEQPKQISLLGVNIGGESRGSLEVEDVSALVNLAGTKRRASATSVHYYRRALAGASGMVHSMYLPVSPPPPQKVRLIIISRSTEAAAVWPSNPGRCGWPRSRLAHIRQRRPYLALRAAIKPRCEVCFRVSESREGLASG